MLIPLDRTKGLLSLNMSLSTARQLTVIRPDDALYASLRASLDADELPVVGWVRSSLIPGISNFESYYSLLVRVSPWVLGWLQLPFAMRERVFEYQQIIIEGAKLCTTHSGCCLGSSH